MKPTTIMIDDELDNDIAILNQALPEKKHKSLDKKKDSDILMESAGAVDPVFKKKEIVIAILKKRFPKFNAKDLPRHLEELRTYALWWRSFLKKAEEIHPRLFGSEVMVTVALDHKYGALTHDEYLQADVEGTMLNACRAFAKEWTALYGWAMACPVCGKPTKRKASLDKFCKPHPENLPEEDCGWECTEDTGHFWQFKAKMLHARMSEHNRILSPEEVLKLREECDDQWRANHAQKERNEGVQRADSLHQANVIPLAS